jgi:uncharacterized membrane protein YhfC
MDMLARFMNALIMIGLPVAVGIYLLRRTGLPRRLLGIGALTFIASQVFHLPFNSAVLNRVLQELGWGFASGGIGSLGTIALLGISAGVFEEVARYLVYRYWIRDARTWNQGLLFGAGHGGIEAIIFGGLALLAFVQAVAYRNVDLATVVPAEQVELAKAQLDAYWAASWPMSLLPAFERAFAICLHLSLAVIVLQVFRRNQHRWLFAAIGWHALANFAGLVALRQWGPYAAEGAIGLFAFTSLGIVFALQAKDSAQDPEPPVESAGLPDLPAKEVKPEMNKIDDSRYFE